MTPHLLLRAKRVQNRDSCWCFGRRKLTNIQQDKVYTRQSQSTGRTALGSTLLVRQRSYPMKMNRAGLGSVSWCRAGNNVLQSLWFGQPSTVPQFIFNLGLRERATIGTATCRGCLPTYTALFAFLRRRHSGGFGRNPWYCHIVRNTA